MSFTKYNKSTKLFNAVTSGRKFVKLTDLYNEDSNRVYTLYGFFPNSKGNFGKSYIGFIGDNALCDMPKHLNEMFENISKCEEDVNSINSGNCQFKIRKYIDKKYKKECYSIEFVDVDIY